MKLNFKEILEGWRNLANPPVVLRELIEEVSRERMTMCAGCPFFSENAKANGYKTFRMDEHCIKCGCPLKAKTRSLSSACPIGIWEAQTLDETRYEIEEIINNESNQLQEGSDERPEESDRDVS